MKLYTLEYDCNRPTVQQVNIPTNTDYKLGIKVKRNGEIQGLNPDNVKLYTGETYTIEPTNLSVGQSSSLASGITNVIIAGQNTTDIAGQDVDARNTFVEVSYDDGATWSKIVPSGELAFIVRVNDRSAGTNNWIAYADLTDANRKWHLYEGGVDTGKTSQTLKMPSVVWLVVNGPQASSWGLTQYPAVIRLVVGIGGGTFERYIYPDEDKTNGYVTFTLSSGDNASYTQETLSVDKGYDVNAEEYNISSNTTGANLTATLLSVSLSQYAGTKLLPQDVQIAFNNGITSLTKNDLLSTLVPYWEVPDEPKYGQYVMKPIVVKTNGDAIYSIRRDQTFNMYINSLGWDINKPAFLYNHADTSTLEFIESITIEEGDVLQMPNVAIRKDRTAGVMFKFTSGTPFSASFALNTNIFKS